MQHIDIVLDSHTEKVRNNYDITLPFKNVSIVSIQVQSAHIPLSRTLVYERNNTLILYDYMSERFDLQLPFGDYQYSPTLLCNKLDECLKHISSQVVTMHYDPVCNKVSLASNKQFSLAWDETPGLANLLGFKPDKKESFVDFSCGNFVTNATYPVLLDLQRYVKLVIPQISMKSALCIVTSTGTHCPFLYVDDACEMDKLTICFLDKDNNVYDFQGQEHVVILRLCVQTFSQTV